VKIEKKPLIPQRLRKINGTFSYVPHSFLTKGFLASLSQTELLVYFLLVLAGDRNGLSYYSQDRLCILLKMSIDDFMIARNGLIKKSLIAFDGFLFQVLSLPERPVELSSKVLGTPDDFIQKDPLTIRRILDREFKDTPAPKTGSLTGGQEERQDEGYGSR
jgi:hypothetical protein